VARMRKRIELKDVMLERFIQEERDMLWCRLMKLAEWLRDCIAGRCPEIGESKKKCFYDPTKTCGCLTEPFCEWLKREINLIEEQISAW